jgi:hypothetical protein
MLRQRVRANAIAWCVLSISACLALAGWFCGFASSLNIIEPGGQFVDCGRAVFGRQTVLPDAACGPQMAKYVVACWTLLGLAALGSAVAAGLLMQGRIRSDA